MPAAHAIHREGAATGIKSLQTARRRRPAYLYASWRHYFCKNHGRAYALLAATLWLLGGVLGTVQAKLRGRRPFMPLNYAGDILGKVIVPLLRGERLEPPSQG